MSLARVALRAPRVAAAANSAARTFSVQTALRGGAPTPTILQGPGAPEGMVRPELERGPHLPFGVAVDAGWVAA